MSSVNIPTYRKQNEKHTVKKLDSMQEKLNKATAALSLAMGGNTAKLSERLDTVSHTFLLSCHL